MGESGASASADKLLALGEMVTDAKAAELIAFYDEDKDNELTPDEWLKAEVPCPASLREEGTVISAYGAGMHECANPAVCVSEQGASSLFTDSCTSRALHCNSSRS